MQWLRWVVVILAVTEAGWMAFDGTRALVVGDYVTPSSGDYAGRLGPWTKFASAVGIEPRSTLMKCIFVVYGFAWLIIIGSYAMKAPWAWWAMLVAAICSIWYLWIGTVTSVIVIILLLILKS
ncbi:MAG: hypothetical protein ACREEM_35570 [Blastocatellia bacterium]